MRSFELRTALLLMATLALSACPSDDTGDEGGDTAVATTTEAAATETGTTAPAEGSTTEAAEGTTTEAAEGTTTGGEPVLGEIEVTVIYDGELTGTLNVVAITEFPPAGPPSAIASDMMPTFPYVATLSGLDPDDYIIFATLDVGGNNPTFPGVEDPQSDVMMPVMVTVDGPGPFPAEVTLVDP